jgi:O-antigen/teichoic acid export membrane protein
MSTLESEKPAGRISSLRQRYEPMLRESDTAKAAGLALAMIANNVIALVSTVVFARELTDYSSLAALISYFLILSVAGQAIQVATAREGVLGHLGVGAGLIATLKRWTKTLAYVTLGLTVLSILLRDQIAQAVGVKHDQWAAAFGIPAGCLWVEISILRGALQGVGDYKSVGLSLIGEQAVRLVVGATLAAVGLGVTGAYLGTPFSFIAVGIYCAIALRRYAERAKDPALAAAAGTTPEHALELWTHFRRAWAPIAGLIVIAIMQNIDLIAAKHRFVGVADLANSYAATAVAAKVLVWVAIGASFYLVPEVSRRRAAGEDTRPVLAKALAIILVCAVPVLLIFAFGAHQLLAAVFKPDQLKATAALLPLGIAFTVLAATYLAIQYMLALKRTRFLLVIGTVAIAEPVLLLNASRDPTHFAVVVLAIQAVAALLAFAFALRPEPRPPNPAPVTARKSERSPGMAGAPASNGSAAGGEVLSDTLSGRA